MTSKEVRKEWKQYVFEKGKDYSFEDAIEKLKNAIMFLKNKRVRENMFLDKDQFESNFHLSELEKIKYIQIFNKEGYTTNDCVTIVNIMDAIYHTFDISKDKAYEIAEYAANNHLTLTKTVQDKLDVDFDEVKEFIDIVLSGLKSFLSKTLESGKELEEVVKEVLKEVLLTI